jgi:cytochrome P450
MSSTDSAEKSLAEFQVPSDEVIRCPVHFYRALHREAPVYRPPGQSFFIVSRYEDVRQVLLDPETYSSNWYHHVSNPHPEVVAILAQGYPRKDCLVTADPPEHRRYRRLVDKVFSAARVKSMEGYIQALIDGLIDAFIDRGEAELISEFAVPLPMSIIADALGVPRHHMDRFKRWSDAALVPLSRTASLEERKAAAYMKLEFQAYARDLLERKRANPDGDLASALATTAFEDELDEHGQPRLLDVPEFIQLVESFIVAGNETTTNAIGSGMLRLIRNPALADRLRAEPERVTTFVEEVLRLDAPIQGEARLVVKDTVLGGVELKAGTLLDVRLGAANYDEAQYTRADEIDLERKNAATHMSFGCGIHFCVGSTLARRELNMVFRTMLARAKNFRLTPDKPPPQYVTSFMVRGLSHLHFSFDKA